MDTTRYQIRRAGPEDTTVLLELVDALADYEKLPRPDEEARKRLTFDGFLRTPPRFEVYLVMGGGFAAGYAIVLETYSSFLAKPTLYIEDLFIRPEMRQQGAGHALLRFLAAEAIQRECGRMEWVCLDWNEPAIRFYEKWGAEHLVEWRMYRMNEDVFRSIAETTGED
ncbi:MAG: GNAT family N-acetyltransferase [Armatimonadaceae bacterium]